MMAESIPGHADCVALELVELQLILWDISKAISAEYAWFTHELANEYYERLQKWAGNLPGCVSEVTPNGEYSLGILDAR